MSALRAAAYRTASLAGIHSAASLLVSWQLTKSHQFMTFITPMSYIRDMPNATATTQLSRQLGDALRAERKRLGLTQAALARLAGIGRQKLIQVEQGKPGVALAAYTAAMDALDLVPTVKPAEVRIDEYPQLKRLVWNRPGAKALTERDALALYERYWDMVDTDHLTTHERNLLQRLVDKHGRGILHV